jgi:general secretion pathway protein B
MSYILDALKKADAERERGSVPGLHSQPQASQTDDDEPLRDTRPLMWVGAGVAITVIALLSWQLWSRGPAAPEPAPAGDDVKLAQGQPLGATPSPPSPSLPPPQADARPGAAPEGVGPAPGAAPPTQVAAPQTTHTPGLPVPPPASPPAAKTPTRQPSETTTSDAAGKASRDARGTASAAGHASSKDAKEPAGSPPNSPAQAHVPTLSELPDDVRRELPQMVVGGAMYADTPSTRMLVINSQVLHEGDQAAPGVVLQEIRLKSAVFSYRGLRYSIAY